MIRYLGTRLLQAFASILGVATAVFFLARMTGDPIALLLPDSATTEMRDRLRAMLGLDKPLWQQYVDFLHNLVTFDFGTSLRTGRPVAEMLSQALPATAGLAAVSLVIIILFAIPLGILGAMHRGKLVDSFGRLVALLGQSLPSFWLGIVLILIFGVFLHWLPVAGSRYWTSYILPAVTIGLVPVAGIVRLTRSSMLEVMKADYLMMAAAKGVPRNKIVIKHALRNALIPVLTFTGLTLCYLLNGSVVVENVFAWPGLGRMILDSVTFRDFPTITGVVMTIAFVYSLVNFLVDVLYGLIDPRIRYR
ncbi:MAG TPA: ABC transporter permease [Reyranella sp.]|jgi:peptide/nickel transport system permease protein